MALTLGLDVGSNSVGWALVDVDNQTVVDLGVRIFQEGVNNLNGSNEEPRSVARRQKRGQRRQYERRRGRKNLLRKILIENNLLPAGSEEFKEVLKTDPYELRTRGLDEKLELHELGRALDHINSRRGFKSNRKAQSEEEDSGTIYSGSDKDDKPGINEIVEHLHPDARKIATAHSLIMQSNNDEDLKLNGYRTIGEYLASLDPRQRRRRKRFTLREHYQIEVEWLLASQQRFHPELKNDLADKIKLAIFYQRPLRSSRHLVGECRFEPNKKRCHRSHPLFQRFRMLQQTNSLRITAAGRVTDDEQHLFDDERNKILQRTSFCDGAFKKFKSADSVRAQKPTQLLGVKANSGVNVNSERIDVEATKLKVAFALGFDRTVMWTDDDWHKVWNTLNFAEDAAWLSEYARKEFSCSYEEATAFSKIKLEQEYSSLSLKAIRKMLPYMEAGQDYHSAVDAAGYEFAPTKSSVEVTGVMPPLTTSDVRNSLVQRSYAEVRKVVNAIVRVYGAPATIRIEMGRDLKKPLKDRLEIQKVGKKNADYNSSLRARLKKEVGLDNVQRNDIQKFKLWESQNHQCIYTGKQIKLNDLFNGATDVDHIIPYSRCLDDGMNNKVVCMRDVNAAKSNKTPLEAADAGIIDATELKNRVDSLLRANKINRRKANLLLAQSESLQDIVGTDFVERQLNDTRYVARLVLDKAKHVCSDVTVTNGTLTSSLRRAWGLNTILPELASEGRAWVDAKAVANSAKSRADHRHHAIDAVVIALCGRSLLQKIATANARVSSKVGQNGATGAIELADAPIAGLRHLVKEKIDSTIVSFRVDKKKRGQLHEETLYGIATDASGIPLTNEQQVPLYVVRKPLESLTPKMVNNIVDAGIREIVINRLIEFGLDVSQGIESIPKDAFLEPLYMKRNDGKRGHRIRRVRVYVPASNMALLRKHGVYVEPGSNDHIQLGAFDENNKRTHWKVVQTMNAATERIPPEDLSFRINEMYLAPANDKAPEQTRMYRVQKMRQTDGQLVFRHHAAASLSDNKAALNISPNKILGEKIFVNTLGKVVGRRS